MKKLFGFLLLVIGLSWNSNAQSGVNSGYTFPLKAGDTVITSSSLDTVFKVIPATNGYASLAVRVRATKISGTISSKMYLYGSLDGVTYVVTDSTTAFADAAGAQDKYIIKTGGLPYSHYQVQVRPPTSAATTESLKTSVTFVLKKYAN